MKITLEDRTVIPTAEEQILEAGKGFDGLGVVTVVGDENFIAKNIKNGVKIWGIEGRASSSAFFSRGIGSLPIVYRSTAQSGFGVDGYVFTSQAVGTVYEST